MKTVQFSAAFVSLFVLLQGANGAEFPASFAVPTAQELTAHIAGKTLEGSYANGTQVQSKYGADGSLAASAPGFYDTGSWRVEDGKLCGTLRKLGDFCNDARFDSGVLHLRRINGEIVRYQLK